MAFTDQRLLWWWERENLKFDANRSFFLPMYFALCWTSPTLSLPVISLGEMLSSLARTRHSTHSTDDFATTSPDQFHSNRIKDNYQWIFRRQLERIWNCPRNVQLPKCQWKIQRSQLGGKASSLFVLITARGSVALPKIHSTPFSALSSSLSMLLQLFNMHIYLCIRTKLDTACPHTSPVRI